MLRRKIVEQYQKGVSQRKIAKSLKLSSSTVHNIIQRFRESGTISVHKGQGRKTILDARDLRALRRHCITYRNATVMEITTWAQEYFQKTLSVNTIHRAIRRCRLNIQRQLKEAATLSRITRVRSRHSHGTGRGRLRVGSWHEQGPKSVDQLLQDIRR